MIHPWWIKKDNRRRTIEKIINKEPKKKKKKDKKGGEPKVMDLKNSPICLPLLAFSHSWVFRSMLFLYCCSCHLRRIAFRALLDISPLQDLRYNGAR
jgi:hypothetical protein